MKDFGFIGVRNLIFGGVKQFCFKHRTKVQVIHNSLAVIRNGSSNDKANGA